MKTKTERIGELRDAIARLKDYCQVRISKEEGADIGFSEEMLPKDSLRSPLEHAQHLEQIFKDAKLSLSTETGSAIETLIHQVWDAARLELTKANAPDLEIPMLDSYVGIRDKAESCIEMLDRDAEAS